MRCLALGTGDVRDGRDERFSAASRVVLPFVFLTEMNIHPNMSEHAASTGSIDVFNDGK